MQQLPSQPFGSQVHQNRSVPHLQAHEETVEIDGREVKVNMQLHLSPMAKEIEKLRVYVSSLVDALNLNKQSSDQAKSVS